MPEELLLSYWSVSSLFQLSWLWGWGWWGRTDNIEVNTDHYKIKTRKKIQPISSHFAIDVRNEINEGA